MNTTIFVPRDTSAVKLAALALEFDGVAIEPHDHACASVDCADEYRGCRILAQVNAILFDGALASDLERQQADLEDRRELARLLREAEDKPLV